MKCWGPHLHINMVHHPTNILNNDIIVFYNHGVQELCTLCTTNKLNSKTLEIDLQQSSKTKKTQH